PCREHAQTLRRLIVGRSKLQSTRNGSQHLIVVSAQPHRRDGKGALQEHFATTASGGCIEGSEARGAPLVSFAQQGKLEEHRGSGCGKVDRESCICRVLILNEAPFERRAYIAEMLAQRVSAAGVFQVDLAAVTRIEQVREILGVAP